MKTNCRLMDVMKNWLCTVDISDSVATAAMAMKANRVGSVLVQRDGNTVGIVTEKDIIRRVVGEGKNPQCVKLGQIMNGPVLSMDVEVDVYQASLFMNEEGIRHLPVSERGRIVGIVTMSDLLRLEPAMLETAYFNGVRGHV